MSQKSNVLAYFVYKHTLYLFPDFEQIAYDREKAAWLVEYDGDWVSFEASYEKLLSLLDCDISPASARLLVERRMFPAVTLEDAEIPGCIFITRRYETAFENEDFPFKMTIPQNAEELYAMMAATENLCGGFTLTDGGEIRWELYKALRVTILVDSMDCCLSIEDRKGEPITHWHPSIYEIYEEVCEIGRCGNVLVLRSFLGGTSVLYQGEQQDCPYLPEKRHFFGRFYYLKAE